MDEFLKKHCLQETYAYVDNLIICGTTKETHEINLQHFQKAARLDNWTYNEEKCQFSTQTIDHLGYRISEGIIKPDPERLRVLTELPAPQNPKSLERMIGMFAYYAKWISRFSDKIKNLKSTTIFPLSGEALLSFQTLKTDLINASLTAISNDLMFVMETDASHNSVSAVLSQDNRPVAFHSRSLQGSELNYASVEKEALAIVDAVEKWRHFLIGRHFILKIDQKSVRFMFDTQNRGKIKNEKILRWRINLASFSFDIQYRDGKENVAADTLTRTSCATLTDNKLLALHKSLCHPGVTRMTHFVRSRNLPHSVEEIRAMTANCQTCSMIKPNFHKPSNLHLVKATQPFDRLSIDFKGPLPSSSRNRYLLTIVDEFSRFTFAYPCPNMESKTVNSCLSNLFSIFGMPAYIHSDRGSSFLSQETKTFLHNYGVVTSRTTPYNPEGNGQVERYNGVIWQSILLALKTKNLPESRWEEVLAEALHASHSLLCTATNATPHERLFKFNRHSTTGITLPAWLSHPGKVLMKRYPRNNKHEPLVDEVELLEANPQYAHIRKSDGSEATVSLKHLAPKGSGYTESPQGDIPVNLPTSTQPGSQSPRDNDCDLRIPVDLPIPTQPGSQSPKDNHELPSQQTMNNTVERHISSPQMLRRST